MNSPSLLSQPTIFWQFLPGIPNRLPISSYTTRPLKNLVARGENIVPLLFSPVSPRLCNFPRSYCSGSNSSSRLKTSSDKLLRVYILCNKTALITAEVRVLLKREAEEDQSGVSEGDELIDLCSRETDEVGIYDGIEERLSVNWSVYLPPVGHTTACHAGIGCWYF